jgi:ABC-type transport system involved in multi-copper enzyme maturation permease subunit
MMAESLTRVVTIAQVIWRELVRRKDLYVLLILLAALLGYLLSLDFFGSTSAVRYILETGMLLAWLFSWILAINLTARQLPDEERRGTVFPLLAKPITRGELIVGKWLGGWTAACAGTILFYLGVILVAVIRGGSVSALTMIQGFLLHAGLLAILAALAVALSTRLNTDAATVLSYVVAVICFLVVPKIPEMVVHAEGFARAFLSGLYWVLPHFEFFDLRRRIVHDWGTASWFAALASLVYATLWTAVLLGLAWFGYRTKLFKRELVG